MDLSARRARSAVRWLVANGIEASRLQAIGCGEQHPIATNETEEGLQTNRRVEFHILQPAPEEARELEGCIEGEMGAE